MRLKVYIQNIVNIERNKRIFCNQDKKFTRRMSYHTGGLPELTQKQAKMARSFFAEYGFKITTVFHRFVTGITNQFSPIYIHPGLFYTCIEPALNDMRLAQAYGDKNVYEKFFPNERFPQTVARCISGSFYDDAYRYISYEKFVELIKKEKAVAVKPAIDSGGGNCVKVISKDDDVNREIGPYIKEGDFIIQCVAKQHDEMNAFNQTSLNIVRLISLYLDGEVIIPITALRVGAPGAFNDNYIDEKDRSMLTIGLNPTTGKICSDAFFASGEKSATCLNGFDYHNKEIPSFQEMLDIARRLHPQLPHLKMVSWDFYVDAEGHASIMELNTHGQGIAYYQYTNGPLFRDEKLTRRILDEVVKTSKRTNSVERA